ncbi:MAG: hypothetical protein ABI577_18820, partial [bacterium]
MQAVWDFLNNPRRTGGICGVIFTILFIIGGPVLQGDYPIVNDNAQDVRSYWIDHGHQYLVGDFLFGIAVVLFFVPFVAALRSVLSTGDRSGGMWPRTFVLGAIVAVILGGAGAAPSAGLAISGARGLDDSTLLFATRAGAYSSAGLGLGFALMLIAAAVVIAQSGVLWRWLALLAAAAAVADVFGGLWVQDGSQRGLWAGIA